MDVDTPHKKPTQKTKTQQKKKGSSKRKSEETVNLISYLKVRINARHTGQPLQVATTTEKGGRTIKSFSVQDLLKAINYINHERGTHFSATDVCLSPKINLDLREAIQLTICEHLKKKYSDTFTVYFEELLTKAGGSFRVNTRKRVYKHKGFLLEESDGFNFFYTNFHHSWRDTSKDGDEKENSDIKVRLLTTNMPNMNNAIIIYGSPFEFAAMTIIGMEVIIQTLQGQIFVSIGKNEPIQLKEHSQILITEGHDLKYSVKGSATIQIICVNNLISEMNEAAIDHVRNNEIIIQAEKSYKLFS